jgi:hypothetical protein
VDNQNLRKEQLDALNDSINMIDEVLQHIDSKIFSHVVKKLTDARNQVNAVATGERLELGPKV